MIGKVIMNTEEGVVTIVLDDNGNIQCSDPDFKEYAGILFDYYRHNYSTSEGAFGVRFLHDFAKKHNGKVSIEKKPEPKEIIVT